MPELLPLKLVLGWAMLFCFLLAQFHHETAIKSFASPASPALLKSVEISSLLGFLAAIGIFIYYFVKAKWYWALALGLGGSLLGALAAGLLFSLVGEATLSKRAFIGWPIAALWSISIIDGLGR